MVTKKEPTEIKEGQETQQIWLTVYSDMVTNLMLFFLMLFAFTRLSVEVRESLFSKIEQQFGGLARLVKPAKEQKKEEKINLPENIASIYEDERRVKIILPSPVLFDIGEAELKKEAIPVLLEVAKKIKETEFPIIVEGHTCDLPIKSRKYSSNFELSAARAFSVIRFLVHRANIPPKRLSAYGYAEFSPVSPNTSEENRAKNRRIEIILVKK